MSSSSAMDAEQGELATGAEQEMLVAIRGPDALCVVSTVSCKTQNELSGMQTEEKKVRKKLTGGRYLTLETRKDGTKFTSRALKEAAERLQAISRSYDQRQHALVEQVCFFMQMFRRHKSTATSPYKSHAGPAEVFFGTAIVPISPSHPSNVP